MTDPMSTALLVFGASCFSIAVGEFRARKNGQSQDRKTDAEIGHEMREELRAELKRKSDELDRANARIETLEGELLAARGGNPPLALPPPSPALPPPFALSSGRQDLASAIGNKETSL